MSKIKRIINGGGFPVFQGQEPEAYWQKVEAQAAQFRRSGATHVMVNQAIVSIPWAMDPENSYLRFTTFGHSPDKFVSSTWNAGIYHEPLLEKNRELLLQQAKLAKKFGFRCAIRCVEMTLMPESFFRRHPSLRGPRVDNPICSTTPMYALCTMLPEVQDHYKQMIRKMLQMVPEIDEMHIFTNDSGAGFCYSSHLYAGSNGPVHCKDIPSAKQAQTFCRVIAEAGREINPEFRVVMTSGLGISEKAAFIDGAPQGVASDIYGAFAWMGGLEDRWQNMAVGPAIYNNPVERKKARDWALADYRARIEPIRRNGSPVYANYTPEYYAGDDARPYETHGIMRELLSLGVEAIIGGAPGWTPYSVNSAMVMRAIEKGDEPTDKAVEAVAKAWVGSELAPKLCEAWRMCDHAGREWPMSAGSGHSFYIQPLLIHMPIVPDETLLDTSDLDYFMTPVIRDEQKMKGHQGGAWRFLHYDQVTIMAYLEQYEKVIFPDYERAIAIFDEALAAPSATGIAADCLREHRDNAAAQLFAHKRLAHWFMAAIHCKSDCTPPPGFPSLVEIIDCDIALCENNASRRPVAWIPTHECLQGGVKPARIALMRKHRNDPPRKVDLSEFPTQKHPGVGAWGGAHNFK
jgi:hypothetical protein